MQNKLFPNIDTVSAPDKVKAFYFGDLLLPLYDYHQNIENSYSKNGQQVNEFCPVIGKLADRIKFKNIWGQVKTFPTGALVKIVQGIAELGVPWIDLYINGEEVDSIYELPFTD